MSLIVVLIILFLLFGGGGFYGYRRGYYGGRGFGGGLVFTLLVVLLLFWALSGAHAETATTSVAVAPWYQVAQPYFLEAFGVVFAALLTWALAILQKHTSIKVTAQASAAVQQAAMNAAGRVFAAIGNKLAPISIDTHSTLIAAEVPKIVAALPGDLKRVGMTPDDVHARLENLIAGKLGQLQATAAVPVPVVAGPSHG